MGALGRVPQPQLLAALAPWAHQFEVQAGDVQRLPLADGLARAAAPRVVGLGRAIGVVGIGVAGAHHRSRHRGGAPVDRRGAVADHAGEAAAVGQVPVGEDHPRHRFVADCPERRHRLGGGLLAGEAVDDDETLGALDHGHGGAVVTQGHVNVVGHAHDGDSAGGGDLVRYQGSGAIRLLGAGGAGDGQQNQERPVAKAGKALDHGGSLGWGRGFTL